MNGSSTLDFQTILCEWKQHNKLKFKMANVVRCNCSARLNGVVAFEQNFTLTFITEPGEPRLLFHQESGLQLNIPLTDLNGYNTEGGLIQLIINPERNIDMITLEFPSQAIYELALEQLEAFTREIILPPTTGSSESE